MSRRVLNFLIDAATGTTTEAAILLPGTGSDTDFICDKDLLLESLSIVSSELRTAGSAIARTRKNGVQGATDELTLDADKTFADEKDADPNDAENQFSRGDRFGIDIVTASWTPTTTDFHIRAVLSELT